MTRHYYSITARARGGRRVEVCRCPEEAERAHAEALLRVLEASDATPTWAEFAIREISERSLVSYVVDELGQ